MSDLSAVKIEFITFFIKIKINRQSVWITIIAVNGKHATHFLL